MSLRGSSVARGAPQLVQQQGSGSGVSAVADLAQRRRGLGRVELPQPRRLQEEERGVERVEVQVSPPEAARLLNEAEDPLQTGALHGRRRLRQCARVEVE